VELRVSVAGFGGDVRGQRAIGVEGPRQGTAGLDPAVGLLDDALGDAGLATTNVAFAVLGVPTPLQPGAGPPGAFATSLREDPARELGRRLGIPTRAENDANLGALGEAAFGAGRGLDSFVYVKLAPHGLGCGLILAGRLFRGATGFAGELGHVQLREDGPLCACGGRGCLVGMLGPSLIDLVQPAYERSLGFADLLELAAADEVGPARMLEDLGRAIGRPLADLCTVLNPAAIVLDGSLGPAGRHVIAGMRHLIDRHSPPVTAEAARVIPGVLGDRAEALGAVALARGVGVGDA
jgi:predicted NBD/HSP70 family sugar kinase